MLCDQGLHGLRDDLAERLAGAAMISGPLPPAVRRLIACGLPPWRA